MNAKRLLSHAGAALAGLASLLAVHGCGDEGEQLSDLNKIRVPVAQFFSESTAADAKRQGCETWADGKIYCQQYPLYLGKPYKVRFVVVSPDDEKPAFAIKAASRYSGLSPQQRTITSFNTKKSMPLSALGLTGKKDDKNSRVLSAKTLRVEEVVFDLRVPTLEQFAAEGEATLPIYAIDYEARSSLGGRDDPGFVTFFAYPDPAKSNDDEWNAIKDLAKSRGVDAARIDEARALAKRNTPPKITSIEPKQGSVTSQEFDLRVTLAADPDKDSKRRLQWFVTKGDLGNQGAASTKWKTDGAGRFGAFAVLRDMQGGMSYAFTIVDAK